MIQVSIVLPVIVVVARLILKGYRAEPVLLTASLALMICTALAGWGSVLPKGVASMGISFLDPFEVMRDLFSTRAADLGLTTMALTGFAYYTDHIGANEAIVRVVTKPLCALRSSHVLLFFSYPLASLLQLAIPPATGLAVLLMGTMSPITLGLGLSAASAAGAITTSPGVAYTSAAIDAIGGSKAVNMDVVEYAVYHQRSAMLATVLVMGVCHFFWQRHCDYRAGMPLREIGSAEVTDLGKAPASYALLPMPPILIAAGSPKMPVSGINLNIITIVLISTAVRMLIERLRVRDLKSVCEGFSYFFKGMGTAFTGVVGLLAVVGIFAHGIKVIGAIDQLILMAEHVGLPPFVMAAVFALVTLAATIITGSSNAPFLAFVELTPQIAASMGANAVTMILPMQQASHMGRAISPVSGVAIAASNGAKITLFDVVKRIAVPLTVGSVMHTLIIGTFY